jgi:hypothetical protein
LTALFSWFISCDLSAAALLFPSFVQTLAVFRSPFDGCTYLRFEDLCVVLGKVTEQQRRTLKARFSTALFDSATGALFSAGTATATVHVVVPAGAVLLQAQELGLVEIMARDLVLQELHRVLQQSDTTAHVRALLSQLTPLLSSLNPMQLGALQPGLCELGAALGEHVLRPELEVLAKRQRQSQTDLTSYKALAEFNVSAYLSSYGDPFLISMVRACLPLPPPSESGPGNDLGAQQQRTLARENRVVTVLDALLTGVNPLLTTQRSYYLAAGSPFSAA